jgi:predicted transcriptional regulator YdeE
MHLDKLIKEQLMNIKEPKLIKMQNFTVTGLLARTKNEDEFNNETAKLSKLWEQFYSNVSLNEMANRKTNSPVYGVYSDYDSDDKGFYSVTAGVEFAKQENAAEFHTIQVDEGEYLVFENQGALPQAIIEIWQTIWHFFEEQSALKRAYKTDFEVYSGFRHCAVYIGLLSR